MIERRQWTVKEVKDELPQVKVRFGKDVYWARVTGRLCQFATVSIFPINGSDVSREVAWETVAYCLNMNGPVQF